jgi:hypothetical protein
MLKNNNANKRIFHSCTKLKSKHNPIIPLVTYNEIENQKDLILNNNKGKSGIYR